MAETPKTGWLRLLSRWRRGAEGRAARRALIRMLPRISLPVTAGIVAILLFGVALSVAFILASGRLIGAVPETVGAGLDSPQGRLLVRMLAVVAGLVVVERLLLPVRNIAVGTLARRVDGELQRRVMRASLGPTGVGHLEDPETLDRVRDAQGVGTGQWTPGGAIEGLVQNGANRLTSLGSAVLVGTFSWWLALLLFVFGVIVRFRLVDDALRGASWGRDQTPKLRRSDYFRDLGLRPEAAKETRVFGLGRWLLDRFSGHWESAMGEIWRQRKDTTASTWSWSLPWGGLVVLAFLLIGRASISGDLDVGGLAVVAQAVLGASSIWLTNADVSVAYGATAVPAVLELERIAADPSRRFEGSRDAGRGPVREIRFEGVAFRYPGRDTDVFTDLDLVIPAGCSLAIVGRNGAGKTTLVKLLARLYEPRAGRITVDGVDLREIDPVSWQSRIGAIFQDFVRYELSVRRNIGYGAVERLADDDALEASAAEARALRIIEGLDHGWDTVLSREYSEGAELSGGEWQRVALARALFAVRAGAGVLVLDEPTANLDVRSEAELFERFLDLTGVLTTLLISHRFSTVRHADRIVVLEEGRILEEGSHDELVRLGGRYAEMFGLQAARFRDDVTEPSGA